MIRSGSSCINAREKSHELHNETSGQRQIALITLITHRINIVDADPQDSPSARGRDKDPTPSRIESCCLCFVQERTGKK